MPQFKYKCEACGKELVLTHSIANSVKTCPLCSSLKFKKLMTSPEYITVDGKKKDFVKRAYRPGEAITNQIKEYRKQLNKE